MAEPLSRLSWELDSRREAWGGGWGSLTQSPSRGLGLQTAPAREEPPLPFQRRGYPDLRSPLR